MRRFLPAVLTLGTLLAASAAPATAQEQGINIGVGGGITLPTGDFKDAAKTGWHGLANVGYGLKSGLGLRGDFFYGQNNLKDNGAGVTGKFKLAGGLGNVTYTFSGGKSAILPYVIGGVGFFNGKADVSGAGLKGSSETKFAWGGGAGLKYKVGSDSDLFVEGRYISVSTSGGNFLGKKNSSRF